MNKLLILLITYTGFAYSDVYIKEVINNTQANVIIGCNARVPMEIKITEYTGSYYHDRLHLADRIPVCANLQSHRWDEYHYCYATYYPLRTIVIGKNSRISFDGFLLPSKSKYYKYKEGESSTLSYGIIICLSKHMQMFAKGARHMDHILEHMNIEFDEDVSYSIEINQLHRECPGCSAKFCSLYSKDFDPPYPRQLNPSAFEIIYRKNKK